MAWYNLKKKGDISEQIKVEVNAALKELNQIDTANATEEEIRGIRTRMANVISGGYDNADTLHNVYLDYGYPETLSFSHFLNMYRRFGIAKNIVDLPVDTTWMENPKIKSNEEGKALDASFEKDINHLVKNLNMWRRIKGLDTRQRVGRYAGMFMRVNDSNGLDHPIESQMSGINALVQMVPLYEGQLKVLEVENDEKSDNYGLPKMYQFNGGSVGSRDEKSNQSFSIHPDRIIIAAEGADNGDIYGIPSLEAPYNSLMDLRKIIGAGGEGFYKNASQSIVFNLEDGASAKDNATLLGKFTDNADDFLRNRFRRSLWTPGMKAQALDSNLANPKDHFMDALYDVSAASKIPSTILIGQQTGRLASSEDSKSFLSGINSRRENFVTEMITNILDWCIHYGILPSAEYEVEWDNLLELSDNEKLDKSVKMVSANEGQFKSGGEVPFSGSEIREAAGFEPISDDSLIEGEGLPNPDDEII